MDDDGVYLVFPAHSQFSGYFITDEKYNTLLKYEEENVSLRKENALLRDALKTCMSTISFFLKDSKGGLRYALEKAENIIAYLEEMK